MLISHNRKEVLMGDIVTGFAAIGVVCILLLVLVMQVQIRGMSKKLDEVLKKVG